jgi:uncharacterized lipoprotein YehR (DUF1307 family)
MQHSKVYLALSCIVVLVALASCTDQVETPKFEFEKAGEVILQYFPYNLLTRFSFHSRQ